jgi:hypothetical protein
VTLRTVGWLLVAYAVIGAVLLLVALVVGGPLMARADRLATSASDSLDAAAAAAASAADSFDGFDDSLADAQRSTEQAATLSKGAADTLDSLADAMSINVLGNQPFVSLADDFRTTAGQLRDLGGSMGGIGQALANNRTDAADVGTQLDRLASELALLRGGVAAEHGGASPPLSWLFYGFLAWQLLPMVAAAIGGRLLLARTRPATE